MDGNELVNWEFFWFFFDNARQEIIGEEQFFFCFETPFWNTPFRQQVSYCNILNRNRQFIIVEGFVLVAIILWIVKPGCVKINAVSLKQIVITVLIDSESENWNFKPFLIVIFTVV